MADPKETVYDAAPHTLAKHQILSKYLKAWLPILARQSQRIQCSDGRLLYVDGFAGAGEYKDNIPGSPLVAIETALQAVRDFPVPVQIVFIELRSDRVAHLRRLVDAERPRITDSGRILIEDPIEGDCEEAIQRLIDEHQAQDQRLGPALFFLDQSGYSSFSMSLIRRILDHDVCEVFSYLNWNLLHPFMADKSKHEGISRAFGGDEWLSVIGLSGKEKEDRFRDVYLDALRNRAGAAYAYPFAMRDLHDRVIYWLFFCSNNLRGLEEMKRAMWGVDRSGGFEFSDKHAAMIGTLFNYEDQDLANDLVEAFIGQELTVGQIEEYSLVNTPACKYKGALKVLEKSGRLEPVDPPKGRRRLTFGDKGMRVRFLRKAPQTPPTLFDC